MRRFKAFTLAEVLITLGVIGVVSAITMPTLIQNHKKQVTVTQLKKAQSIIEQAVQMSVAQNGTINEWNFDLDTNTFAKTYIIPYIKITEDCGVSETKTKCSITGNYLNGSKYRPVLKDWDFFITFDGMKMGIRRGTNSFSYIFDINGNKGPSLAGKDIFNGYFAKDNNGMYKARLDGIQTNNPHGISEDNLKNHALYGCNKTSTYAGQWCGGMIEYNGWQITDDYPW